MNSLFKKYGSHPTNNPFQNIQNTMNQFNQFASAFRGNPQQQVQALLNSGKMSQQQYQQLQQMANMLQSIMGKAH